MNKAFEAISHLEYPGRLIIIGTSPVKTPILLYALTGRSPSSQARRLEKSPEGPVVFVKPTDEEILKTGQPELLIYSSFISTNNGIAISNGKQTDDIATQLTLNADPISVLRDGLIRWTYEPDEPNYTPRISGVVTTLGAALCIYKRAADGSLCRSFFDIPRIPGTGKAICTYAGTDSKVLPSFNGEPISVELPWSDPQEAASQLYEALAPQPGKTDFRIAALCAMGNNSNDMTIKIKNRHG